MELRRLRQLEEENAQLKRIVADLTLDKQMLQDVLKKALKPRQRGQLVSLLLLEYRVSERRACATAFLHRWVYRYLEQPRDDRAVRQRMKEIAATRVRYGLSGSRCCCGAKAGATITSALTAFTRKKG